jgi:uncharacterized membrane protein
MNHRITAIVLATMACLVHSAIAAPPGSGAPQILPTVLGTSSNCARSFGTGINNGTQQSPLQVTAQGVACSASQPKPLLWTQSTGMLDLGTIGGAGGGSAEAVSDDGTTVGWLAGGVGLAFVRPLGGPMEELPKLAGMTYASADDISSNGQFILGFSSREENGQTIGYAVRWEHSSGTWQPTQIDSGGAVAVSDSGAVAGSIAVVGSPTEARARVWTDSGSVVLPGIDTRANDISADGTVVVGYRLQDVDCRRPPCGKYEVPMIWTLQGGAWTAHELTALDGVDSEASAVAEVNGRTVIVGYGYTKKDAIMRAVYWQSDEQGSFGPPVRLAGLDGNAKSLARATGVNASGQVVGYAGIRTSSPRNGVLVTVMWTLP